MKPGPAGRVPHRGRIWCILATIALAIGGCSGGRDVDWARHGNDDGEQRFSQLKQIDASNVARLGLIWEQQFETFAGQQSTPIQHDGVLYVSTEWSMVFAFDAKNGTELWRYDPEVPRSRLIYGCCGANNRGVAIEGDRVFVGTFDGRLVALNRKTGRQLWSVVTVDQSKAYTITGAPRVIDGKVLIGNGGAEYGVRGYVSAYDSATGKLAWRFYTTPNPDDHPDGAPSDEPLRTVARQTWFGDVWKQTGGGGTAWDSIVVDPKSGMVFVGVGNGTPHSHKMRSEGKGDNLFLSSIIALRASDGAYVWHYQTTPGDNSDYTATQPIMLATLKIGGQDRDVVMQAPKNGFFYVLDRATGKLISAKPYTAMTWATGVDMETGRPIENPGYRDTSTPFLLLPSTMGGHSWQPMAFNPELGLVYIPVQEMPQPLLFSRTFDLRAIPRQNTGLDMALFQAPETPEQWAAMREAVKGALVAWDPVAGKSRWTVRHSYYINGGTLATASGLVFQGQGEGELVAYDAANGRRLWAFPVGTGIVAPPITYSVDGRQHVAVMVGYGGAGPLVGGLVPTRKLPGRLLVFSLDGTAAFAPAVEARNPPLDLTQAEPAGDPRRGNVAYNDQCLICHGLSAGSTYYAELRRSQMALRKEAFAAVLLKGALSDSGMVSFEKFLTPRQAEDIRAYVLEEARKEKAEPAAQTQASKK